MFLPSPPNTTEKYLYADSGRYKLYTLSIVTTSLLIIGMFLFVAINPLFFPYTIFVLITSAYLIISNAIGLLGKDFDYEKHVELATRHFDKSAHQEVDLFLPICGEKIEVLRNTWESAYHFRAAHEGKINIYVLDDGHDFEARGLAGSMRFNYITRETNELKKAGNLRNAFAKTKAEFFIILDADFTIRKDFLLETLPYMFENENVGILQTPQYFETKGDLNLIEKGSAQIQELFYRLIQTSRDTFKGAICVGTSALYRRSFLEKHGGTAAIEWSEDVHSAVLIMKDLHDVKYIPLILTKGMCADNLKTFFTQFYRWSTGSMSLMLDKSFWLSPLTIAQKICFSTGFGFYVTTGLAAAMSFIPSIYLLIFKPQYVLWFNILWAIPSLLLTNIYMRFWQKTGYSWAAVQCRAISSYAHLFALHDILLKKTEGWIPTGSGGKSGRYQNFVNFVFYHTCGLGIILFSLIGFRFATIDKTNFIPLTLLCAYHIAALWPAIKEFKFEPDNR